MALVMSLASKLASMMLIVVVGYLAVRLHILKAEHTVPLSRLVITILQPCLIISSFQIELTKERLAGFLCITLFATVVYIFWIFLTKLLKKPLHLTPVDQMTLIYSNVGNLILPLVNMVLGPEMVFYGSAVMIPFNLFIWSHGVTVMHHGGGIDLKKAIKNPNVFSVFIGIFFLLTRIPIPDVILTSMTNLSAMVGPTSMLVIGMVIATTDLKRVFTYKRSYPILIGRLLLFPLAAMLILFVSGFLRFHPQFIPIILVAFMALAAPPASTVSQMAVLFNEQPVEASIYNVMGVFLCTVTIPLIIAVYQFLFM